MCTVQSVSPNIIILQEAVEEQLRYEEITRNKMNKLNQELTNMVIAVETAEGDALINQTNRLCRAILSALPLPLARGHCWKLWGVLVHSVFTEWRTGGSSLFTVYMYNDIPCSGYIMLEMFI